MAVLESAGVEFIPENGGGPGVRLRAPTDTGAKTISTSKPAREQGCPTGQEATLAASWVVGFTIRYGGEPVAHGEAGRADRCEHVPTRSPRLHWLPAAMSYDGTSSKFHEEAALYLDVRFGLGQFFTMLDWDALHAALQRALLKAVFAETGGPWRAAALDGLYAETDGVITAPSLYLNDDGEDMESPPDWKIALHNWAPVTQIDAMTAEACSGTVRHWEDIFARYHDVLVRVCVEASGRLGIPVFFIDHDRYEETLGRCLSPSQLHSMFPRVVATQAERARVSALPPDEQIAYYISRLSRFDGLIGGEEAWKGLRALGSAAIPTLLPLLRSDKHPAAMLIAEIGVPDDTVITALAAALSACARDSGPQRWSCVALAQLGRLDLVLASASALSREGLAEAVAAPYTAFRDHGAHPLLLDYRPLEDFLSAHPETAPQVADVLKPGTSYCAISAAEAPEALRGTTSLYVLVRKHAVCVLGDRRLGDAVGRQVIPRMRILAETDPESEVRRLAGLSLQWWKADR